ncbi:hypothetical protein [Methylobacterium sp. J-092]|uniref:hypothetical protein n=1 Tax=Methylobacterium sp. J-092 TaxID=2836667 RepID=UPI001FBAB492|nr:hypothetical protein [Methylobacterium sp. J-092]MCJ2008385.1 hypothetical protein [Methylobacterium sp. J-092]
MIEYASRSSALAISGTPAEHVKLVTDLAGKTSSYDVPHRLHKLHDASAADFRNVSTNGVVRRRRAYQMLRIARVFYPTKIPAPDLEAVEFTKIYLLAEKNEKGWPSRQPKTICSQIVLPSIHPKIMKNCE